MSDVLITPASSKIEFKDASSNIDGTVKLDSDGNLELTSGNGISFGDVTSDVFIGNGSDNVDLKFEADGSITGTSGVTLTLGSSGSNISFGTNITSGLNVGGNITLTGLSSVTAGGGFYGALYGDVIYDDTTYRFAPTATGSVLHSSGGVQRFRINPSGAEVVGVLTATSFSGGIYAKYTGASGSTGNINLTTRTLIDWMQTNTTVFTSGGFTNTGTLVTVPTTGLYQVNFNGRLESSGGFRSNMSFTFEVDGTAITMDQSLNNYIRFGTGHNEASANFSAFLEITAGQTLGVSCLREASADTVTLTKDASSLTIIKVA